MDNSAIMSLASKLAAAITESEAAVAYSIAASVLRDDTEVASWLREYIKLLKKPNPTFNEERSLSMLYSKLCLNLEAKAFLETQDNLLKLLADVNSVLCNIDIDIDI